MNVLPRQNHTALAENTQPLIAALYARVSTSRQEQEETIESQVEEIKTKITLDGNVLPPEHIFIDDGWTGEMLQRPSLDLMRDAAMEGKFQTLYVYDRGRLSRVFAYQEIIIEELINKDIKFVTLHDVQAQTAEERVLQAMQGVFHEYERVKIAERMRRGKLYKARAGIMINGHALYGWRYIKKTDTTPAHYEVNEEEARVVRMLFEWVGIERISLRDAIKRLYDLGIPPRKGKSEFWTKGPIVRILRCESYLTGEVYYNKHEAVVTKKPLKNDKYRKVKKGSRRERPREDWIPFKVPALINDRALYEKVQKILDLNQKYARKNRKFEYLLSGLVYCECGNRRAGDGSNKHGHHYYRCAERIYNFPLERRCDSKGVNAALLDAMTWNELTKVITNPKILKECIGEWLKLQTNNDLDNQEIQKLKELIGKIIEEEKRYAKAYGSKSLEFEQFQELMKETRKRKQSLQKQLDEISSKYTPQVLSIQVDELFDEAKKILESLDLSNKLQVIRDIIDRIIVKERSKEAEVWIHLPLSLQKLGYEPISRHCWSSKCWKINSI